MKVSVKALIRSSHGPCVGRCLSQPLHYLARFAIDAVDADNNGTFFYTSIFQIDLDAVLVHFYVNDGCIGLYPRILLCEILVKKRNQVPAGEAD